MRPSKIVAALILLAVIGVAAGFYYSFTWGEKFLVPVHVGMTKSQVQSLVGPPPRTRDKGGAETWDYTHSWSREARVYFDTIEVVWAVEMD